MYHSKEAEAILGNLVTAVNMIQNCMEFCGLIPEVSANIAYALPCARTPQEVAAVPGRITVVRGYPYAAVPDWGASDHLARRIIESRKYDSRINAIINFKHDEEVASVVQAYCRDKGLLYGWVDRSREPEAVAQHDHASMPWKVEQLFSKYGAMPRIYYEGPGWGKEPLFLAHGTDAVEVAGIVIELARRCREISG
jgi:hydroxymethylpyrimidine/phosphomethylpyrimidine kinase